jgi:hypothetical protein
VFDNGVYLKANMLYKFKSKVTGDLIMLEPDAKRLLKIMGREDQVKGIFVVDQMAQAIHLLQCAIEEEEAQGIKDPKQVPLRNRSQPMLKMLKTCLEKSADVVWGV